MNLLDGPVEILDCDETLTVVRQGRRVDDDMTYVDGLPAAVRPPVTFEVICTIQPMGGRDLLLVPEAFRTKETLWMWSRPVAFDDGGTTVDVTDVVLRRGLAYQVQSAEDWGSYSRCMLVAIDIGPYARLLDRAALPAIYPGVV